MNVLKISNGRDAEQNRRLNKVIKGSVLGLTLLISVIGYIFALAKVRSELVDKKVLENVTYLGVYFHALCVIFAFANLLTLTYYLIKDQEEDEEVSASGVYQQSV